MSIVNINVGLLGHVDSGKTSLAKALTTVKSTACFDKHPQSQQRGITIDLGFSSFFIKPNELFRNLGYEKVQVTLVDCPGHASLIKKIIGGAQIIDFMLLVIDINKGVQTQTAECLVIAEILQKNILIVLNKCDLIPEEKRESTISKVTKKIKNTLKDTHFNSAAIVVLSADPKIFEADNTGVERLIEVLAASLNPPVRQVDEQLVLAVDHCFSIRGKGTILTGTMIQGRLNVNDIIEIPHLKTTRKVKTIQMFKKDVVSAIAGDRIGVCIGQLESSSFENGVVCAPGHVQTAFAIIISVRLVKYFKSKVISNSKYHVSSGHETTTATILLFKTDCTNYKFDIENQYEYVDELNGSEDEGGSRILALLQFEQPICCAPNDVVIVSKLDIDIHKPCCRLALYGNVLHVVTIKNYSNTFLTQLLIYKWKEKRGSIYRIVNDREVIVHSIFKKETKMHSFINLRVTLTTGEKGVIASSFGQGGKVKVALDEDLSEVAKERYTKKGKDNRENGEMKEKIEVILRFKRYLFDKNKCISQN